MLSDVDDTRVTGPECWVMSMIRGPLHQNAEWCWWYEGHWTRMLGDVDDMRGSLDQYAGVIFMIRGSLDQDAGINWPGCWVTSMIQRTLDKDAGVILMMRGCWTRMLSGYGVSGQECWMMSIIRGSLDQDAGLCRWYGGHYIMMLGHVENAEVTDRGYTFQRRFLELCFVFYLCYRVLSVTGRWIEIKIDLLRQRFNVTELPTTSKSQMKILFYTVCQKPYRVFNDPIKFGSISRISMQFVSNLYTIC